MNTQDYPEHTAPEPPAGMKWEYRGIRWDKKGPLKFYGCPEPQEQEGHSDPSVPLGHRDTHYFEAVPLTVEPKVPFDKLMPVTPEEANEKAMSFKRLLAMTPQLTDEARNWIVKETVESWPRVDETPLDPKGDAGSLKAPLYLLPSHPLHEASWVLKTGAEKYGPWNWRQSKVCASTYRSAMQRHLDQWFDGSEDMDSETQRSHLAHVVANACILMDAMKHGTLADDRP